MPARQLTLADVAEILNISVGQVRSLVKSGDLPAFQMPNGRAMWRVGEDELEAFLERQYARTRERIAKGTAFDDEDAPAADSR